MITRTRLAAAFVFSLCIALGACVLAQDNVQRVIIVALCFAPFVGVWYAHRRAN